MSKKLVVVESPTKAKTIRKYLGKDFIVESCMGHVRDLPQSSKDIPAKLKKEKWAQLGVNVDHNFEPLYCVPRDKEKIVKSLREKLSEASELYLATDEDREGESISWHLVELLKPNVPTKRMVFHEITKDAIQKSLKQTRQIDTNLVRAQEARRILDRLVGYTISPLIWKKVAYGLSAGRVQSVAVRLLVEREHERLAFVKSAYWGIKVELEKSNVKFEGRLSQVSKQRVATGKDFDGVTGKLEAGKDLLVLDETRARQIEAAVLKTPFIVSEVEQRPVQKKPAPPFITSTLQQEANRKMGLSARETMQVAQKLYEQGFITYMRTDSTFLSQEAIQAARASIKSKYGTEYLPDEARNYAAKKVKGAQEAHEAIRPAGTSFQDPDGTGLTALQLKLYDLIWKRTMASQMVDARQKQVLVKITAGEYLFQSSGMVIEFPGFLRAYVEGSDDPEAELLEREVRLPALKAKDDLKCNDREATSHETKPPARYTEATLIQKMEREGIGRPSTYASIIGTIIDRGYVKKQANALVPTFTAIAVIQLLSRHLPKYVDLNFTSNMEKSLDNIADGDLESTGYLQQIYFGDQGLKSSVATQEEKIDPEEARTIKLQGLSDYEFRVGRYGAYLKTERDGQSINASIPESESPGDLTKEILEKIIEQKIHGADSLGKDPETGLPIYVLSGRYGPYVQLGDITDEDDKPKRVSLPQGVEPSQVDLKQALQLLSLPKVLGTDPDSGEEIKAGLGRFGPFVVKNKDYRSIPKAESIFTITFERALELLRTPKKGRGAQQTAVKELGLHPQTEEPIQVFEGKYGPYVKVGKVNASLTEGESIEKLTLARAVELLAPKLEKTAKKSKGKKTSPKTAKKASAKSTSEDAEKKEESPKVAAKPSPKKATVPKKKAKAKAKPASSPSPKELTDKLKAKSVVVRRKSGASDTAR